MFILRQVLPSSCVTESHDASCCISVEAPDSVSMRGSGTVTEQRFATPSDVATLHFLDHTLYPWVGLRSPCGQKISLRACNILPKRRNFIFASSQRYHQSNSSLLS